MEKNIAIMLISAALIIGFIIGATVTFSNNYAAAEKNAERINLQIKELNNTIEEKNLKIIELQENDKYISTQLKTTRDEKADLQDTYNELFTDATICYWANRCLYFKNACSTHFNGEDATKLHRIYSDQCDMMIKNWDKYYSNDSSVGED